MSEYFTFPRDAQIELNCEAGIHCRRGDEIGELSVRHVAFGKFRA